MTSLAGLSISLKIDPDQLGQLNAKLDALLSQDQAELAALARKAKRIANRATSLAENLQHLMT